VYWSTCTVVGDGGGAGGGPVFTAGGGVFAGACFALGAALAAGPLAAAGGLAPPPLAGVAIGALPSADTVIVTGVFEFSGRYVTLYGSAFCCT